MNTQSKNGISITIQSRLQPAEFDYCFLAAIELDQQYGTPNIAVVSGSQFDSEAEAVQAGEDFRNLFFSFTLTGFSMTQFNTELNNLFTKYACQATLLENVTFKGDKGTLH